MNSKERFVAVCRYEIPDRFPVDYLAHSDTDKALKMHFQVQTDEELRELLGCDFHYLSCRDISQNEGFMKYYKGPALECTDTERICPFGIRWRRGAYDHKFSVDEVISSPLGNIETEDELKTIRWPGVSDFDFSPLLEECDANPGKVIIGGLWTGIMGDSYRMIGFEKFMLYLALNPRLIQSLIHRMTEVYMELNNALFSLLKGKIDVWFFGNDFGSQNGLLMSPQMWRDLFMDDIKRLTILAHSYGVKVMMHSCGAISEIIPYLIEAGIDILDPVQVSAANMDPSSLSRKYGGKIVFHGGIDTQRILINGTSEQVISHVGDVIGTFGTKGGYIFAPSQILGSDIPIGNILTMYHTANNFDMHTITDNVLR